MSKFSNMEHTRGIWSGMKDEQQIWVPEWQDLANYILPRRYHSLYTGKQSRAHQNSMRYINDSTGTRAARTLAAGMMNGITSPARPWFRIEDENIDDEDLTTEEAMWLAHVTSVILGIMARSNYYNAKAAQFLDLSTFATSPMIIYEDEKDVIRCYVSPCGEYSLLQDGSQRISGYGREIWRTAAQLRDLAKVFNVDWSMAPPELKIDIETGGTRLMNKYKLIHLIEPHGDGRYTQLPKFFQSRDLYYFEGYKDSVAPFILKGFREKAFSAYRWEVMGNSTYGTGPGWDALPDIKQLQSETHSKGKGLARQVEPPMLIDSQLEHRALSIFPRGKNFITGLGRTTDGMKPVYSPDFSLQEVTQDIAQIKENIRLTYHTDLFRGTSDLSTVRSASEIDVRETEKLIQLGPVVHRVENEGLDIEISRIYAIAKRKKLIRNPPESMNNRSIKTRYISVLADAQASVGVSVIERYLAFVAQNSSIFPDARQMPNIPILLSEYGKKLRIPAGGQRTIQEVEELTRQEADAQGLTQAAELGPGLAQAASNLSGTDVGGAAAALNELV